jgi:hypothetical protein
MTADVPFLRSYHRFLTPPTSRYDLHPMYDVIGTDLQRVKPHVLTVSLIRRRAATHAINPDNAE